MDNNTKCSNDFLNWQVNPPLDRKNMARLRHAAQTWERVLWTTGGLLKLTKCLHHLMQWKFTEEGAPKLNKASELPELWLMSGTQTNKIKRPHHNCGQAHKTLGHKLLPNFTLTKSSSADETKQTPCMTLLNAANKIGPTMAAADINKQRALQAHHEIHAPRMTFTLGACHLPKKN